MGEATARMRGKDRNMTSYTLRDLAKGLAVLVVVVPLALLNLAAVAVVEGIEVTEES